MSTLPRRIAAALAATGHPWALRPGKGGLRKIIVRGRLVGTLNPSHADADPRRVKNIVAQIRRAFALNGRAAAEAALP